MGMSSTRSGSHHMPDAELAGEGAYRAVCCAPLHRGVVVLAMASLTPGRWSAPIRLERPAGCPAKATALESRPWIRRRKPKTMPLKNRYWRQERRSRRRRRRRLPGSRRFSPRQTPRFEGRQHKKRAAGLYCQDGTAAGEWRTITSPGCVRFSTRHATSPERDWSGTTGTS